MRTEALAQVSMKGIALPVVPLRLVGVSSAATPWRAREDRRLSQFVGRVQELSQLLDAFAQARGAQGQVIGIVGEPGSGKSRLLHEFRERIDPTQGRFIEGRCLSYGKSIPFLPLQEVTRALCDLHELDAARQIGDKIRQALGAVGIDAEERAPFLLHLLGVKEGTERIALTGPETIKARIFDTLRQLILRSGDQRALILCVEDLHWIDGVSEEFLTGLVDALSNAPVLLLTTYRPG